jgi:signal transduction histidine kinase
VRIALRPGAAERLEVGAPPSTRLPVLLGMLVLTAALAAVALMQLRRAHELARLRADFTSSVSHELRTPLAQILLFGETLSLGRARGEAERRMAADTIVQEARRLMHMVENVLLFARAERGPHELDARPVALAPLVRDLMIGFSPIAEAAGVTMCTQLDDEAVAMADASAVRQIVLNLLDNAVKYGPPGQTVTLAVEREGDLTRIAVEDEGPGVEASDYERIWLPFVRLTRDRNTSGYRSGSGLGLAVVRDLARLQRGEARIAAGAAGGARFIVELPAAPAVAPPDDAGRPSLAPTLPRAVGTRAR